MGQTHGTSCLLREKEDAAQKMSEKISGLAELGALGQGKDWVIKALHPSHPSVKIRGIPDQENGATLFLEYKTRYYIRPPTSQSGPLSTWDCALTHQLNPLAPLCTQRVGHSVTGVTVSELQRTLYNRAAMGVVGGGAVDGIADWRKRISKWRPCYGSVTCQLDAPATASQGTWMAANVPMLSNALPVVVAPGMYGQVCCRYLPETVYPSSAGMRPQPGYAHGVMAPGDELGGCYLIQNLEPVADNWVGESQLCGIARDNAEFGSDIPGDTTPPYPYRTGTDENGDVVEGLLSPHTYDAGSFYAVGEIAFPNNNKWLSHAIFNGMSTEATLIVDLVQGWEVVVRPESSYSMFVNTSPPYDPQALAAYHEIRRHLLDAYPAAYNDWDKLWAVIRRVAAFALPFVARMGPIGAVASAIGSSVVSGVDALMDSKAKKKAASRPLIKTTSSISSGPAMNTKSIMAQRRV